MITIRSVTPRLATFSKPFARFGFVPIGGRSTAVQLRDGTVWVLASTPLDASTRAKLQEMGEVRCVLIFPLFCFVLFCFVLFCFVLFCLVHD
jgi:hypothetical protein